MKIEPNFLWMQLSGNSEKALIHIWTGSQSLEFVMRGIYKVNEKKISMFPAIKN